MALRREKVILELDVEALRHEVLVFRDRVGDTVWRGVLSAQELDMPWRWEGDDS